MHPAWFSGPKTDEEIKQLTKNWLKLVGAIAIMFLVIGLTQDFVKHGLINFIEWTCSFNGTVNIEALK